MSEADPPWGQDWQPPSNVAPKRRRSAVARTEAITPSIPPLPPGVAPVAPPALPVARQEFISLNDYLDHDETIGSGSLYRPIYCKVAEMLIGNMGATDFELAEFIGVHPTTLNAWRMRYPEFKASCRLGVDEANDRVERALFARAIGYEHKEEKIFCNNGEIFRAQTVKHYAPDVAAITLWLTNKRKKQWSIRTVVESDKPELVSVDDLTNKLFQGT